MSSCVLDQVEYECSGQAAEFVERLLVTVAGSFLGVPCRRYSDASACERLLPRIGTKPHSKYSLQMVHRLLLGGAPAN